MQPDQSIPCMHTQAMKQKKSIEGKMKTIQCAQVGGGVFAALTWLKVCFHVMPLQKRILAWCRWCLK